jgi:hypothetical protein
VIRNPGALPAPVRRLDVVAAANVGFVDCLIRIAFGLVLTSLAVDESVGAWAYVGLFGLATGTAWVCPLYRVLGISTLQRDVFA